MFIPHTYYNMTLLITNPEEKRPLRRSIRMWEDNIKIDSRETECDLESTGSG
jgi:hypothetical protein